MVMAAEVCLGSLLMSQKYSLNLEVYIISYNSNLKFLTDYLYSLILQFFLELVLLSRN